MLDLDVLYDKLEQFETAEEIAAFLIDQQVQAVPRNGKQCAFAAWVQQVTEMELMIHVSSKKTAIYRDTPGCARTNEDIIWQREHTTAMERFIYQFDEGVYPKLISKNWITAEGDLHSLKFKQEIYAGQMYAQPYQSYHSSQYASDAAEANAYAYSVMLQVKSSTTANGATFIHSVSVA